VVFIVLGSLNVKLSAVERAAYFCVMVTEVDTLYTSYAFHPDYE